MEAEIVRRERDYALIRWSDPKLGFGELLFKQDGCHIKIDAECLCVDTTLKILQHVNNSEKKEGKKSQSA